jgi:Uma2 family endonuclease
MPVVICDPRDVAKMIARRKRLGHDRFDEVWDGVYVMSPIANDEHQEIATFLSAVIMVIVAWGRLGKVRAGINVSDRIKGWNKNYRVPDVAVFLKGCAAKCCGTHWFGGPDFAAEIVSKRDRSREKFDFYAKVGTRELLIVDRYPWALELYGLKDAKLELIGSSTLEKPDLVQSSVLPITFQLLAGVDRPVIEIARVGTEKVWRLEE